MAPYFQSAMFSLKDAKIVADIRGYGLLAAIDTTVDGAPGRRGHVFQKKLFDNGLNLKTTGDAGIVAPPFISTHADVDTMTDILRRTLAEL